MSEAPPRNAVVEGDCVAVMAEWEAGSIDAIVTDPPYGLEFMGREWDKLGGDAGTSKPGIGDRPIEWPAYGGSPFGGANPTCAICGGRSRGAKRCRCEEPDWRVKGRTLRASAVPKPGNLGGFADGNKPSFERVRRHLPEMQEWHERWAREALRVAKPGAYLLAFGGTRTYHRLAAAIEDAGWEIRDCLVWAYASGFPKSLNVSKAIDKAAGATREVVGVKPGHESFVDRTDAHSAGGRSEGWEREWRSDPERVRASHLETAPATEDAKRWSGWGTALKPAWEPIVMARKPLRGTAVENVLEHGTGALNIDATRIPMSDADAAAIGAAQGFMKAGWDKPPTATYNANAADHLMPTIDAQAHSGGRWPANVVLTDPIFDGDTPGVVGGGTAAQGHFPDTDSTETRQDGWGFRGERGEERYLEPETYSRFFLIPKSARSDREPVTGNLTEGRVSPKPDGRQWDIPGSASTGRRNIHPTVKPVELMRHLVRLVTPPGGLVLDPFLGSGSTAIAVRLEGFGYVGIEREPEYVRIARARLADLAEGLAGRVLRPTYRRTGPREPGLWDE